MEEVIRMQAVRVQNPAPSEALQREDVPGPLPEAGQVAVKVSRSADPADPDYISRHVQPCYPLPSGAGKHTLWGRFALAPHFVHETVGLSVRCCTSMISPI